VSNFRELQIELGGCQILGAAAAPDLISMDVELRRKFEIILKLYYNKRGNININIIYHKFEKFQISGAVKK